MTFVKQHLFFFIIKKNPEGDIPALFAIESCRVVTSLDSSGSVNDSDWWAHRALPGGEGMCGGKQWKANFRLFGSW